ncbi:hypothetical protein ACLIMP_07595 [Novosphingobium aerophilum]|nr:MULTISPECIES: hypothetical protein [unclassified Novosphingobium]TCM39874.1 hypothetical protein EDF59_105109 [Novosphingobium sp. ST904]WRT94095.1 hypothetical protein U9J33_06175 [Novosphingobium sp. RL4]
MAKSQKRSTREIRKPKAAKTKPAPSLGLSTDSQVVTTIRKPRDKL